MRGWALLRDWWPVFQLPPDPFQAFGRVIPLPAGLVIRGEFADCRQLAEPGGWQVKPAAQFRQAEDLGVRAHHLMR